MTFHKSAVIFLRKLLVVQPVGSSVMGCLCLGLPHRPSGFARSVLHRCALFVGLPLSGTPWGQNHVVFISACMSLTPHTPSPSYA